MSQNSIKVNVIIISVVLTGSILSAGFIFARLMLSEDQSKHKRAVHMVTLIKPPPPPKIEEKPPEPEMKKEEIKTAEPLQEEEPEQAKDAPPPGDQLGVDAEGSAGSDSFGLVGKKGGQALIGSGGSQYAWYQKMITDELQAIVNRLMRENGGIPDKNLKAYIRIVVDDVGNIVDFSIIRSSGNEILDKTVKDAIVLTQIEKPPPFGMPRSMKFKISPQG